MSNTIDQHIVGLDFDTSKFDRGVASASNRLSEFQNSLGKTDSSNVFGKLEKAAATLSTKLGPLGSIASESFGAIGKAASSLVTDIAGKFSSIANAAKLTFAGISAGVVGLAASGGIKRAMNIEQAKFQLRGLGADVDAVMANVNDAVTGTAYGLDQAAVVASQLTASGIQAGDQMTRILKGIAGVASMTGKDFGEVGHIFTTVAGQGKLMTMQLRQLEYAGINAAATMAKAWGVTEDEVREMVTQGDVSFQMFSDAMNDAFGEHAQAANELFSGSLSNVKAALSRIGEKFATPGLEHLRDILNALRPVINDVNNLLTPFVGLFTKWSEIGANSIIGFLESLNSRLIDMGTSGNALKSFADLLDGVFTRIQGWGSFWEKIVSPDFFKLDFWDQVVKNATTGVDSLLAAIDKLFEKFPTPPDDLQNAFNLINGLTEESQAFTLDNLVKKNPALKETLDLAGGLSDEVQKLMEPASSTEEPNYVALVDGANEALKMMGGLEYEADNLSFNALAKKFSDLNPTIDMMRAVSEEGGGLTETLKAIGEFKLFDLFKLPPEVSPEAMQQSMSMMNGLTQEAKEMYPALTAEGFAGKIGQISLDFRNWAENVSFTKEQIEAFQGAISRVKGVFTGFGTILSGVFDGIVSAVGPFFDFLITKALPDASGKFNNLFDMFGKNLPTAEAIANGFRNFGKAIGDFFTALKNGDETPLSGIVNTVKSIVGPIIDFAKQSGIISAVGKALGDLFNVLFGPHEGGGSPIGDVLHQVLGFFNDAPARIIDGIRTMAHAIGDFISSLGISFGDLVGLLNALLTITMVRDIRNGVKGLQDTFKNIGSFLTSWLPEDFAKGLGAFEKISKKATDIFDKLGKGLDNVAKNMMPENLLKIAAAIGILAASLWLLSTVNPERLVAPMIALVALGAGLVLAMKSITEMFSEWSARDMTAFAGVLTALMGLGAALLLVSVAVKLLSTIDPLQLATGLIGVSAALYAMCLALESMSNLTKGGPLLRATAALTGMAMSLLLLTGIIEVFGHTDPGRLAKGIIAMGVSLGIMVGALTLISKYVEGQGLISATIAITGLTAALLAMTAAIVVLGGIGLENLVTGLAGILGSLLILGVALDSLASIKIEFSSLAKLIVMLGALSVVMIELTAVCTVFAAMGLSGVGTSLLGLAGSLGVLLGAVAAFGAIGDALDVADVMKASAAIIAMSTGIVILSAALAILSGLGENIGYSLAGLAGGLLLLGVGMAAMQHGIPGAAAMVVAATAILILTPALAGLAKIPFTSLVPSLLAIAVAIGVFAAASRLIASAIPAMAFIATVLSQVGFGALAMGGGIALATVALIEFGDKGVAAITKVASSAATLVTSMIEIFTAIGVAILSSLSNLIPQIVAVGISIISSLLSAMQTLVPQFLTTGLSILIQIGQGLIIALPTLLSIGFQVLIALVNGLADTIRSQHDAMYEAGKNLFMAILEAMSDCLQHLGSDILGFIGDLPAIISGEKPLFASAGTEMGESVVDNASTSMSGLSEVGSTAVTDLMNSLGGFDSSAITTQFDAIPQGAQISMDQLPQIGSEGANGLLSGFSGALEGVDLGGWGGSFLSSFSSLDFAGAGSAKASELVGAFSDTTGITGAGTTFGTSAVTGFETGSATMADVATAKTGEAVAAVEAQSDAASGAGNTVGSNFGSGMSAGIGAWIGTIAQRAREMVAAAKAAADEEADSASPSKEMIKRGKWFGQGFEVGISNMIGPVSNTAADMVDSALGAVEDYSLATQSVGGIDWDIAPIIRPVLDLTDVEIGMAQLNNILGGYEAYPVGAYGRSLSSNSSVAAQIAAASSGPVYNLYIDGAVVNSTPEIQRVLYDTFDTISTYGGMNHGY